MSSMLWHHWRARCHGDHGGLHETSCIRCSTAFSIANELLPRFIAVSSHLISSPTSSTIVAARWELGTNSCFSFRSCLVIIYMMLSSSLALFALTIAPATDQSDPRDSTRFSASLVVVPAPNLSVHLLDCTYSPCHSASPSPRLSICRSRALCSFHCH